jgi:D-alanyl-D-alanine carboxypeptidase/D-alanyl-D-alanine-endopeptidase (penicillin-binding protein 4)
MKKYLLLGYCCFMSSYMSAQTVAPAQAALQAMSKDAQMKYASYSLTVLNAKTGEKVFSINEDMGLAPASCLKTVTAATTLSLLGTNYQYKTLLAYDGTINADGELLGNLVIKGAGDPSLGSPRYQTATESAVIQSWIQAIKKAGIKKVIGKIIGDDSIFDTQTLPDGWIWQDMGNYYGAGVSGLSWRENQFDILLKPGGKPGDAVSLTGTRPNLPYLTFVNELTTGKAGSGDQAYVYLPPYSHLAYLRGTVGADEKNFTISGAIPDPAYEGAYRLDQALQEAGISSSGVTTARVLRQLKQPLPQRVTTLYTTLSPTLDKLIYWFLKKSINLYGEHLVKTLASQQSENVSTNAGVRIIREHWQQAGIDSNAINMMDGSGLSPANRITTAALSRVLFLAQKEKWFPAYYDALPEINGIKMKDGYISNVRAYAGYITPQQGSPLLFAFIVNNFNGSPATIRQKMWKVLDSMK